MTAVPVNPIPPPSVGKNDTPATGGHGFITVTCASDLKPAPLKWKVLPKGPELEVNAVFKEKSGKRTIRILSKPHPVDKEIPVFIGKTTTAEIGFNKS